jgi:organic hydroperoxide reductase OsmC/OhrA
VSDHRYTATVRWNRAGAVFTDRRYSRVHTWFFDGGIDVRASASPQIVREPLSDAHAVDPEEAFIASIASCHMLFFLDYAARAGLTVDAYDDAASGTLAPDATGRLYVDAIELAPRIRFSGDRIPSREEIAALHERAHHDCFLANSVKSTITIIETPVSR